MPTGKTWYLRDPGLRINNKLVPYAKPNEVQKYLGVRVSPWKGLFKGLEVETFTEVISRVHRLSVKPMQQVLLLRKFVLPKYTHGLIVAPPSRAVLREIDRVIRKKINEILHLPTSNTSAFLYTSRKQGGLELLEIEKMVLVAAL